jgi:hypothetical protein
MEKRVAAYVDTWKNEDGKTREGDLEFSLLSNGAKDKTHHRGSSRDGERERDRGKRRREITRARTNKNETV